MTTAGILGTKAISGILLQKNLAQLKQLCMDTGVTMSGTKPVVAERLATHFTLLHDRPPSNSILSFDLGYRNLAYCHMTRDATIVDWARIDLELPAFHPSVVAPIVRRFLADRVTGQLDTIDAIVVEQQRARTNGSHSVLEHTMRVNCVESILWCGLHEASEKYPHVAMTPVQRALVDRSWQSHLETVMEENNDQFVKLKQGSYRKKLATSLLVQKWIDTNTVVTCSEDWKLMFMEEKKKDDLSDCLLQALSWFQWEQHGYDFIRQNLVL